MFIDKRIQRLTGAVVDTDSIKCRPELPPPPFKTDEDKIEQILGEIYSVNPDTGLLSCDYDLLRRTDLSPAFQNFVQNVLYKPLPNMETGSSDADFVLDTIKSRSAQYAGETDEFISRLQGYIEKYKPQTKLNNERKDDV